MMFEDTDDAQLMTLISEQSRPALEALYERYSNTVYSLAMHMLRDAGKSEEVTQDAFFNVWRRAGSYNASRGSVTAWLFSIAHNRTIDELRKRRRDQTHVQHGVDLTNKPEENNGSGDPMRYATLQFDRSQLKEALFTLRPEQREIVILAYFGGLTHSEISNQLGQPLGTVKTRMRLALKKLRSVLGPQYLEQTDLGL
ncbi:MAG: sigma-70 family RNA polymerase sigma factor [Chloroflexi bacterium]|nr:sigma-70 family RNA polymerase sigma factor [Chloroflexota bacterium]MCI0795931.1 sigma-70 family RNA polymerase sigma factor [Chloroflexota bacterium]MCI0813037.1 sigma-70 family RNA polymerase sigma factor [Chloroflexota bacterium]MCI0869405.1 sigma-70 family RNA polymerase sigma factor [Chloroflexota bacterium]